MKQKSHLRNKNEFSIQKGSKKPYDSAAYVAGLVVASCSDVISDLVVLNAFTNCHTPV